MKIDLNRIIGCLIAGIMTLMSCSKKDTNAFTDSGSSSTQSLIDTLRGREFIFDVKWRESEDGTGCFIWIDSRPDLFSDPARAMEVTMRFDTSLIWQEVVRMTSTSYASTHIYLFSIYFGALYVFPRGSVLSLVGSRAFIRVKFL